MKRLLCLLMLALFLVSCSGVGKGDPFTALEGDFEVRITSVCEENECEFSYDRASGRITFLAPNELTGFVMSRSGEKILLSIDGVSAEISEYAARLLLICEYAFSAEAEDITDITARKSSGATLTEVKTDNCTYVFASDGTPLSVNGVFDGISFEMTFADFTVKK